MIRALKFFILIAMFLTGFAIDPLPARADESAAIKEDRQNQAAQDWLDLIDQGQYKGSWDAASAEAKGRVTSEEWESSVAAVRGGLGERLTRGLETRQEVTTIEDWPEGKYAVLTFFSSFTNKQQALETLTLKQDPDGNWRVVSYSIK